METTQLSTRPVLVGATGSGRPAVIGWPANAGSPVVVTGDRVARRRCIQAALSQVAPVEQACVIPVATGPGRSAYVGASAATAEAIRVMAGRLDAVDPYRGWGMTTDSMHPVVLAVDESQVCQSGDGITRGEQAALHAQLLELAMVGPRVRVQVILGVSTLTETMLPATLRDRVLVVDVHTVSADAARADVSFTLTDRLGR